MLTLCLWDVCLILRAVLYTTTVGGAQGILGDAAQHGGAGAGRNLPGAHGRQEVPRRQAAGERLVVLAAVKAT